ncbi:MAG TPA: 3-deoxy-manno-octulosonate cytidylyltransferase [Alphaproteobacteria bacterium]|nr:3-deoxy-manno-octulosonate cytidylyltransferase [Alphaproteobacteria bacterium]
MSRIVTVIPARMAASRLPGKPLADIHGRPMIVHVWERAVAAGLGPVVVACSESEVFDAVVAAGGTAVMTDPDLPSGSDRIHAALQAFDPDGAYDVVVNVQGDLPTLDPALVRRAVEALGDADIATLVVRIAEEGERTNPNVVKAVVEFDDAAETAGRALYFTRLTAPWGEGDHLHHIGLYVYRRGALERFVALPPAALERREKLEQLRALAAGMSIRAARVDTVPLGVDTPADLEKARALLAPAAQP